MPCDRMGGHGLPLVMHLKKYAYKDDLQHTKTITTRKFEVQGCMSASTGAYFQQQGS